MLRFLVLIATSAFLLGHSFNSVAQSNIDKFDFEDEDAVVLLDKYEFEVLNENKAKFRNHVIMQINRETGKKYGLIYLFENKFVEIKEMWAKVIDSSGEVVEKIKERDMKKQPFSAGYILYDDTNYKWCELTHHSFPYKVEYFYEKEMSSLFFWPDWYPQQDIPVLKSTYEVLTDTSVHFNTYSIGSKMEPVHETLGDREIFFWKIDSLQPAIDESRMPPENEIQIALLFAPEHFELGDYKGTANSWQEFGQWYNDLVKERYSLENDARIKIAELLSNGSSVGEKAKRLYSFLQKYTRYVAILLNVGGWQPHTAKEVFESKYGDCKDLSTLMISMLKESGIQAYPALVRTRDEGILISDFPSNQFNHMITFVPLSNDTIWLECTADYLAYGELPYQDEGCEVLVIKEEGGEIVRTPTSSSSENSWFSKVEARLFPIGTLEITGSIIARGNQSDYLRLKLNNLKSTEQKGWLEKLLGRFMPKVNLASLSVTNLADSFHLPLEIDFEGKIEKFAVKSASRLFFNPNIFNRVTPKDFPGETERIFPVYYNYAYLDVDSIIIDLPSKYTVEANPEEKYLHSDYCDFQSQISFEDNKLIYSRRFELKKKQIPVSDYSEYIEMLNQISRSDNSKIVLARQ